MNGSAPSPAGAKHPGANRRPVHLASVAVVLGMFIVSGFSVTVAVTNNNAAKRAQRSALLAELSETALEALLSEESAAEQALEENDAESRREYVSANAAAGKAIRALDRAGAVEGASGGAQDPLTLHAGYSRALGEMLENFAGGSLDDAEAFEDKHADPFYDPLAIALARERKENNLAAQGALRSIGRVQQILLFATPLLFGATLALTMLFLVKLARSRGEVTRQAAEHSYQSLHDGLTGLPNRALLGRRAAEAVERAAATGTPVALMLIDLDRFKEINDTLGHYSGDLVLVALADRLRGAVRSTDTVARLGGDEFAILLPQVADAATALRLAAKIQLALVDSIDAGGVALDVDASIGIALSGEHGDDVATLLQHADIAMYRAKEHDLGVQVYDEDQNDHSREQLGLLGELRRALDNDELVLEFQPKVGMKRGEFCGAEALVRWEHPTRGLIGPGAFIPAAERTAMIRPLTRYVINAALAECRRWKTEGMDLQLAVNISARNLLDTNFPNDVAGLLVKWDLPASCLLFEVTESAIMVEPARAEAMLLRIASLGIVLAIDDFGAGYTSLAHLRTLPVKELKIDQSLVGQMAVSAKDALIVRSVIDLAYNLGMRTVAEGVEDASTLDRLKLMGCDVGQGYHIARPMTGAQLSEWCSARETLTPDPHGGAAPNPLPASGLGARW